MTAEQPTKIRPNLPIRSPQIVLDMLTSPCCVLACSDLRPDLIVLRALVKASKQCPSLGRDHGYVIVFTRKLADGIQVFECHERDKLDFTADVATQQLDAEIARNLSIANPNKDLFLEQCLVRIRVCRFSPAVPNAKDHRRASLVMVIENIP